MKEGREGGRDEGRESRPIIEEEEGGRRGSGRRRRGRKGNPGS